MHYLLFSNSVENFFCNSVKISSNKLSEWKKNLQLDLKNFDETIIAGGGEKAGAFAVPGDRVDVFIVRFNRLHQIERWRVGVASFRSSEQTNQIIAASSRDQTRQRTPKNTFRNNCQIPYFIIAIKRLSIASVVSYLIKLFYRRD